jgi:4-hydroxy-3-methylbut-2-enyl diphosphate reductase
MIIEVSKYAGFCFGVARAIDLAEKIILRQAREIKTEGKPIFILGELVHNEHVIKKLKKSGVKMINSFDELDKFFPRHCDTTFGGGSNPNNQRDCFVASAPRNDTSKKAILVITAHGIDPKLILEARARGLFVLDTTCPKVTKVHQIAKYLNKNGYKIFIYGDKDHVEVLGILGAVGGHAKIIEEVSDAKRVEISPNDKIGLISQTTQDLEKFEEITKIIRSKCENFLVFDTICDSTRGRQADIKNLALNSDLMIVVGSKSSANTKRLYQISKKINSKTCWIDDRSEIKKEWFSNVKTVGLTAGASTPGEVIDGVVKFIKKF